MIAVNVDLHPELEDTQSTNRVDPKPAAVVVKEKRNALNSSASQSGGRPGAASQLANAPAAVGAGAAGSRTEEEQSDHDERSAVSTDLRQVKIAGLTPRRVTVSVGVPSSYYEEVWKVRNSTLAGESPKKPDSTALAQIEGEEQIKIQQLVERLLPVPEDAKDTTMLVTVKTLPHIPLPEIEKPTTADHALTWLNEHAGMLGMGCLGIVSLLMVRSIVRSVPTTALANIQEADEGARRSTDETTQDDEVPSAPTPRLRRRGNKTGPSLRDELVDIVRDDPDSAANILRSWIGSGT